MAAAGHHSRSFMDLAGSTYTNHDNHHLNASNHNQQHHYLVETAHHREQPWKQPLRIEQICAAAARRNHHSTCEPKRAAPPWKLVSPRTKTAPSFTNYTTRTRTCTSSFHTSAPPSQIRICNLTEQHRNAI
ncbi:hypothetical protein DEO72_LG4g52 [Vigna unguiculata]|uniref:Uncharacterized protein n=1 Tax=Vigna unguiculata TaxID=3917 RepID=A0A4D6LM46_VIGUN|nr:hypothetical protein DEO72_LG4g52 [Vigna unguiculata]